MFFQVHVSVWIPKVSLINLKKQLEYETETSGLIISQGKWHHLTTWHCQEFTVIHTKSSQQKVSHVCELQITIIRLHMCELEVTVIVPLQQTNVSVSVFMLKCYEKSKLSTEQKCQKMFDSERLIYFTSAFSIKTFQSPRNRKDLLWLLDLYFKIKLNFPIRLWKLLLVSVLSYGPGFLTKLLQQHSHNILAHLGSWNIVS